MRCVANMRWNTILQLRTDEIICKEHYRKENVLEELIFNISSYENIDNISRDP